MYPEQFRCLHIAVPKLDTVADFIKNFLRDLYAPSSFRVYLPFPDRFRLDYNNSS